MPPQISVTDVPVRGFAGNARADNRTMTCINTGTVEIPFGCAVIQDAASGQLANRQAAKLPSAATDVILGIVERPHEVDTFLGTTLSGPAPGSPMVVCYDGEVLVRVESAVVKGKRPFVRITANGTGKLQLGAFRADADEASSTATAVEVKGAEFRESGAAGSLVYVRFSDMANRAAQSA